MALPHWRLSSFYAYCETRWSPSRSSVSAIAAKPINNPFVELIQTNPDRSSKRSGFFMPADVPWTGASGVQRTTTVLWTPRAGNQSPDPTRASPRRVGRDSAGTTDPPLPLRDHSYSGTCPAMPGVRRGRETERRMDAPRPFYFLLGRLPTARIVTALASAPRDTEPQGVRRARERSDG